MNSYTLPFATINILREDIAEVIINDGVEMDLSMVNEYHEFLLSHLKSPFSLLVNKQNSYAYDFEAQQKVGALNEINAISVVVYNDLSELAQNALSLNMGTDVSEKMNIFSDRSEALKRLIKIQDKLDSP